MSAFYGYYFGIFGMVLYVSLCLLSGSMKDSSLKKYCAAVTVSFAALISISLWEITKEIEKFMQKDRCERKNWVIKKAEPSNKSNEKEKI